MFAEIKFAVLRRPRTQALLDESIRPAGFAAQWRPTPEPLGWALAAHEKNRDLACNELAGGEMSLSSFVQAKSRGAPLQALPVFLKRCLVQRSLFCPVNSDLNSPEQLLGKKIGLVSSASSMAVWVRGILRDGYGVAPSQVQWQTLSSSSHDRQSFTIPDEFSKEKISAWEELDGYPHDLDSRETFLLSLLDRRELDALVSFQARIDCERIRPLLQQNSLSSHPLNSRLYPINHVFVVKTEMIQEFPSIAESLLSALNQARRLWAAYQSREARQMFENEMAQLGFDPFAYRLDEVEKTTVETFVGYLLRENLISRKLGVDELFYCGF